MAIPERVTTKKFTQNRGVGRGRKKKETNCMGREGGVICFFFHVIMLIVGVGLVVSCSFNDLLSPRSRMQSIRH